MPRLPHYFPGWYQCCTQRHQVHFSCGLPVVLFAVLCSTFCLGTHLPSVAPDLFRVFDVGLFSSLSDRFYFLLVFCLLENTFSSISHCFCSALVNTSLWLPTEFIIAFNYSFQFAKGSCGLKKLKLFICDYVFLSSLLQQAKHFQQAFGSIFLKKCFCSSSHLFFIFTVPLTLPPVISSSVTTQDLEFLCNSITILTLLSQSPACIGSGWLGAAPLSHQCPPWPPLPTALS